MNCLLVVVDVHPDEFIDLPGSPKFSEIIDEPSRIAGNADDGTVNVDNEGSRGIDLRSRRERNIWRPSSQSEKGGAAENHPPSTPNKCASLIMGSSSTSVVM
jgi:hypothetical protein